MCSITDRSVQSRPPWAAGAAERPIGMTGCDDHTSVTVGYRSVVAFRQAGDVTGAEPLG
ncbi:hypothetical protein FHR81_004351 [Actinoalloteichus hoggarensis]|uniref:Uncharacterized protein n=1 Tax=Actinoalloteichus hoggarensis TaxID=1470176 RepID=A0A221WAI1_9PSEU|nr:hypothetical protein AHOG_23445 [Actinoalloteichus hoggarensis]MBB5923284.1 hypothetical protein [Actinoalloteichus hoggarensis]